MRGTAITSMYVMTSIIVIAGLLFEPHTAKGQTGKESAIKGSGAIIRDGAIVMKDFHDSYEGKGWIAGVVVSASSKVLVVSVPKGAKKEYAVNIDQKTSTCIAKAIAADSIAAVAGLKPGQRVSVSFRKGIQTADRVVDQGYEIIGTMGNNFSGTATEPLMPHCD